MIAAVLLEPFALWCALRATPELARRSIASVSAGRVVQASPKAKQQGVTPGMREGTATLRVEGLVVIPHDAPALQLEWVELLEELHGVYSMVEPLNQGRVFIELAASEAAQLAEAYGARVGVATTKEPALLAALATFEGKARVIKEGEEREFMRRLPLRFARGLGLTGDAVRRLRFLGVEHVGELLAWRPPQLEAFLGEEASLVLPYLHGPWGDRVAGYQPPAVVEARYTFDEPATEPAVVTPVIELLAKQAYDSLGGRMAGRLTVTVVAQGLRFHGSRLAKEPLRTPGSINRLAERALGDTGAQALGLESLTLLLSGLVRPSTQGGLWRARGERRRAVEVVTARYPGAMLAFREVDPFTTARDKRFVKVRLDSGEVVREEVMDAPGSAARSRHERPAGHAFNSGVAKAGV